MFDELLSEVGTNDYLYQLLVLMVDQQVSSLSKSSDDHSDIEVTIVQFMFGEINITVGFDSRRGVLLVVLDFGTKDLEYAIP